MWKFPLLRRHEIRRMEWLHSKGRGKIGYVPMFHWAQAKRSFFIRSSWPYQVGSLCRIISTASSGVLRLSFAWNTTRFLFASSSTTWYNLFFPVPDFVSIQPTPYGAAQERFDNYLADSLMRSINVSHLDSKQCPCLQATDFIAGAIARKYRDNDYLYYNMIQHKIIMVLGEFLFTCIWGGISENSAFSALIASISSSMIIFFWSYFDSYR